LAGLGGVSAFLAVKAHGSDAWHIDTSKCVNSRLGAVGVETCLRCATECVLPLSAVRAILSDRRSDAGTRHPYGGRSCHEPC